MHWFVSLCDFKQDRKNRNNGFFLCGKLGLFCILFWYFYVFLKEFYAGPANLGFSLSLKTRNIKVIHFYEIWAFNLSCTFSRNSRQAIQT